MPRKPTSDENAEQAVERFTKEICASGYDVNNAWLAIVKLLVTCEVWKDGKWKRLHGEPVLLESNEYRVGKKGPSKALREACLVGVYISTALGIPQSNLSSSIGGFLKGLKMQPNNPRGHAFRSIAATFLEKFGDPGLTIEEELDPRELFPGSSFNLRSEDARVDIAVHRGSNIVALCSVRWSYRHDRVDMLEEATAYIIPARRANAGCRFFGITAEMSPSRLRKVLRQTAAVLPNAAMESLVHLHPPLATTVIGHQVGELMDLADWARSSFDWR